MDDYAPRSPDLTAVSKYEDQPLHPQHQQYRGSISGLSPFTPIGPGHTANSYFDAPPNLPPLPPPVHVKSEEPVAKMELDEPEAAPRRGRGRAKKNKDAGEAGEVKDEKKKRGRKPKALKEEEEYQDEDEEMLPPADEGSAGSGEGSGGIEVKTKFPVARIKRIMQADEDVGKVAQVTPVVVGKSPPPFHCHPPG